MTSGATVLKPESLLRTAHIQPVSIGTKHISQELPADLEDVVVILSLFSFSNLLNVFAVRAFGTL